jgi:hypothetical protein
MPKYGKMNSLLTAGIIAGISAVAMVKTSELENRHFYPVRWIPSMMWSKEFHVSVACPPPPRGCEAGGGHFWMLVARSMVLRLRLIPRTCLDTQTRTHTHTGSQERGHVEGAAGAAGARVD